MRKVEVTANALPPFSSADDEVPASCLVALACRSAEDPCGSGRWFRSPSANDPNGKRRVAVAPIGGRGAS
jgi:hypothetical protein